MVPAEVSSVLFNHFIDQLNQADSGYEFIILKQGLEQIVLGATRKRGSASKHKSASLEARSAELPATQVRPIRLFRSNCLFNLFVFPA